MVAVFVVAAALMVYYDPSSSTGSDPKWYYPHLALGVGDALNYSVEGSNGSGQLIGHAVAYITDISHNLTTNAWGMGQISAVTELNNTSWSSMIFGPTSSECYGKEAIETVYGTKHVDKFIKWSDGALLISYIGSESGVGYRLVVANRDFGMNVTLSHASVEGLEELDLSPSSIDRSSILVDPTDWVGSDPGEDPSNAYWEETRGYCTWGLYHFDEDVHLLFRQRSDGAAVYLFTADDIAKMEQVPRLTYDPALAIPNGNGTIDHTGALGLVYYVKDTTGMEDPSGSRYERAWYL